jgi:hypothetical protein
MLSNWGLMCAGKRDRGLQLRKKESKECFTKSLVGEPQILIVNGLREALRHDQDSELRGRRSLVRRKRSDWMRADDGDVSLEERRRRRRRSTVYS